MFVRHRKDKSQVGQQKCLIAAQIDSHPFLGLWGFYNKCVPWTRSH